MFSAWWLWFSQKCNQIFFSNVLYHWRGSQRAQQQVLCCQKRQSSKRKSYTFFWWCGVLKKNSLCYVAWSLALFNSTYAKSTHQFLLLFTMSCRKLCDTYRISLMLNNLLMERGKKCSHFLCYQSSHACILMLKHPTMPWAIHMQNDPSPLPMSEQP